MRSILTRAVENGTGKNAKVPGYKVAGKTGTAQKAGKRGYEPGKYVSSFIGFLSAENITISMIVVINEPFGIHTGGAVACPVFKEIAKQVIQYLTIGQRFYAGRMPALPDAGTLTSKLPGFAENVESDPRVYGD
jgi:stage V sporulation protein D (sporulation-specific penicillin-binding protein)